MYPSSSRMGSSRSGYHAHNAGNRSSSPWDSVSSGSDEEDFAGAVGQLSLNEDDQVRYHGKASGLHLLGVKDRLDRRNEGGIWLVSPSLTVKFGL